VGRDEQVSLKLWLHSNRRLPVEVRRASIKKLHLAGQQKGIVARQRWNWRAETTGSLSAGAALISKASDKKRQED
jgi:hypothetical protein